MTLPLELRLLIYEFALSEVPDEVRLSTACVGYAPFKEPLNVYFGGRWRKNFRDTHRLACLGERRLAAEAFNVKGPVALMLTCKTMYVKHC